MIRLHVPTPLAAETPVTLTDPQAHYLRSVMRLAEGAALLLFNGQDGEWQARLTRLGKQGAEALALHQTRAQAAEPDVWLAFAPVKRDATDLIVQKATELGVSAIRPVFTARTNTARLNLDRLGAIAREAAEQSERLSVPALLPPQDFAGLLAGWPAGRRLAAAMERHGTAPPPAGAGGLLVGPEGGFTPAELDALRAARFVSPLTLGPRILRAETAVVAGLALLQAEGWSTT